MSQFRFTIQRMMIAVAIVAVLIGLHQWKERGARHFLALSNHYFSRYSMVLSGPADLEGDYVGTPDVLDSSGSKVTGVKADWEIWNYNMGMK